MNHRLLKLLNILKQQDHYRLEKAMIDRLNTAVIQGLPIKKSELITFLRVNKIPNPHQNMMRQKRVDIAGLLNTLHSARDIESPRTAFSEPLNRQRSATDFELRRYSSYENVFPDKVPSRREWKRIIKYVEALLAAEIQEQKRENNIKEVLRNANLEDDENDEICPNDTISSWIHSKKDEKQMISPPIKKTPIQKKRRNENNTFSFYLYECTDEEVRTSWIPENRSQNPKMQSNIVPPTRQIHHFESRRFAERVIDPRLSKTRPVSAKQKSWRPASAKYSTSSKSIKYTELKPRPHSTLHYV